MRTLSLFAGFGVEIEYMIVDAATLDIRPEADLLIKSVTGQFESSVDRGPIEWSNELALHVIELKTSGPAPSLQPLAPLFHAEIKSIRDLLRPLHARLMPSAMHPWMNPLTETRLWPHDYNPVYEAFNRIFDCRGHGWANLQSLHLNLPFADDAEFVRLHAAVRIALPMLPALAASSPFCDGRAAGKSDARLAAYRTNCQRIPSISGLVIPEQVSSISEYHETILQPIYRDIAPFDADGTLQDEWVNARGAIARFDRNTIEIRVIDTQESPRADLAAGAATTALVHALTQETWSSVERQHRLSTEALAAVFNATVDAGAGAIIRDPAYLDLLGLPSSPITAGRVWRHLVDQLAPNSLFLSDTALGALEQILEHGPLSDRLLRAAGPDPDRATLKAVYERLCDCLDENSMFTV